MPYSLIEFLFLAGIAIFVGWRLFVTLGQDSGPPEGRSRVQRPVPRTGRDGHASPKAEVKFRPVFRGVAASGLEAIHGTDNDFDPHDFLKGARTAYEMIVNAYARADRAVLKSLTDADVYKAWDKAISGREGQDGEDMQLLRIRKAEITAASLDDDGMARITVQYQAELGDGETSRTANEFWTFRRKASSSDPNWLLDDVDTAD